MTTATEEKKNGIQRSPSTQLDELDLADNLAFLAHTQQQIHKKTNTVAVTSRKLGLNIHQKKTKILNMNTADSTPFTLTRHLEEAENFLYLGSTVDKREGRVTRVKIGIEWSEQFSCNLKTCEKLEVHQKKPRSGYSTQT